MEYVIEKTGKGKDEEFIVIGSIASVWHDVILFTVACLYVGIISYVVLC